MKLIDTHAHLSMLKHDGTEPILGRAAHSGVEKLLTVGTQPDDWNSCREMAEKHPGVFYSVGLHPHSASQWPDCEAQLRGFFPNGKPLERCVAIGETGLDFALNHAPPEQQKLALRAQFKLAADVGLPLILHCRDAFEDLFSLIDEVGLPERKAVLHCFTGSTENAMEAIRRGMIISFSGILTFKNAADLRETAKLLPMESIVVETDCPYLAPAPNRGKPNEPSFLIHTVNVLAEIRSQTSEEVAAMTYTNAERFFRF